MIQRHRLRYLGAVLLLCFSTSACGGQGWVGVKVMPVDSGAPFKVGDRTIGTLWEMDWPRTVERENGDWVWLSDTKFQGWVQKSAVESIDAALRRQTEAIRNDPQSRNYNNRGIVWYSKGEYDFAIKDYSEAARLAKDETSRGRYYRNRGETWLAKGDAQTAIADLTEGIRLLVQEPTTQYEAYRLRATAYDKLGNKSAADSDRREVERIKATLPK